MLKVFAAPALSEPPTSVRTMRPSDGTPRWARNITGTVVTSNRAMIRGVVSATYARTVRRHERVAGDSSRVDSSVVTDCLCRRGGDTVARGADHARVYPR